jgi:hypothetical protein
MVTLGKIYFRKISNNPFLHSDVNLKAFLLKKIKIVLFEVLVFYRLIFALFFPLILI